MKKLLAVAAMVAVVGGGAWVFADPGVPHLYDANLVRLAETPREGFCAGVAFGKTQGQGSAEEAAECRTTADRSTERDVSRVVGAFCQGAIASGISVGLIECIEIMEARRLWPTLDGALTTTWTRRYPRPGSDLLPPQPNDRGEQRTPTDRTTNERND